MLTAAGQRRLDAEWASLAAEEVGSGVTVRKVDGRDDQWVFTFPGPDGTPYQGGVFEAEFTWPSNYPFEPPAVRLLTPIFHPNIYSGGAPGLSILQADDDSGSDEHWSISQTARTVMQALIALVKEPDALRPANVDAARLYTSDSKAYASKAAEYTAQYAKPRTWTGNALAGPTNKATLKIETGSTAVGGAPAGTVGPGRDTEPTDRAEAGASCPDGGWGAMLCRDSGEHPDEARRTAEVAVADQPEDEVRDEVEDLDASFSSASQHIQLTVTGTQPAASSDDQAPPTSSH